MTIRIGIMGYGNLGRGVECAIKQNPDMELAAVFTRRDPKNVRILTESAKVYHADEAKHMTDKIDVLILCGGSATDLPVQTPEYAKYFTVVDSFDTHARIPEHFAAVDAAAKEAGNVAVISAADVTFNENACATYTLLEDGKAIDTITLGVPGIHNVYNSLAAIAAAHELGIRGEGVRNGLLKFTGTHRRFEKKGMIGGVTVIDDYAHHPQEIAATLAAAKNYPHREIWCVFQPHTYTRTKALMEDFAKALSTADHVVLADIYAARETDNLGISSETLAEKIAALGTDTHYFPSFDAIETFLLENCVNGDLLITMGAGDIVKVGEKLLGQ